MNALLAVALVCSLSIPNADCTRDTALDIAVSPVKSPYECLMAGQASMARTGVAEGGYVKVVCERRRTAELH